MKGIGMATGILVAGLAWGMSSSGVASDGRKTEKPATAATSDNRQGKPLQPEVKAQDQRPAPAVDMPIYRHKPPTKPFEPRPVFGTPRVLEGAFSRGTNKEVERVSSHGDGRNVFGYALVPEDQFGLTAQAQPSLCWYLLEPVGSPVVFVMGEDQAVQPLLDRPLSPPLKPGMHCVQLADHGVRLSPGKLYVWFVEVRIDSENRSGDKVAGG